MSARACLPVAEQLDGRFGSALTTPLDDHERSLASVYIDNGDDRVMMGIFVAWGLARRWRPADALGVLPLLSTLSGEAVARTLGGPVPLCASRAVVLVVQRHRH